MRALTFVAALTLVLATLSESRAQSADPVLAHYSAYRTAIEAGDLDAAETAAEAALAASEAHDSGNHRTGVLALNLAITRLELEQDSEAVAPARRAQSIAAALGDQSALDPLLIRLVVGRAELEQDRDAYARLRSAVDEAAPREDLVADVYVASIALGRAAMGREDYDEAAEAWAIAARAAEGAPTDPIMARANALFLDALSLVLYGAQQGRHQSGATNFRLINSTTEAREKAIEAQRLMRPFLRASADTRLNSEERAYALALALESVVNALLLTADEHRFEFSEERAITAPGAVAPPCPLRLVAAPRPAYPAEALSELSVGSVVVRFEIDETGAITHRQVAGTIPMSGAFDESVEAVFDRWTFRRVGPAELNCTMAGARYVPLAFALRRSYRYR